MKYRDRNEAAEWRQRDPVAMVRVELVESGALTSDQAIDMEVEATAAVQDAIRMAREMPLPEATTALEDVVEWP